MLFKLVKFCGNRNDNILKVYDKTMTQKMLIIRWEMCKLNHEQASCETVHLMVKIYETDLKNRFVSILATKTKI